MYSTAMEHKALRTIIDEKPLTSGCIRSNGFPESRLNTQDCQSV